jgi:ClpP class serine protease
MEPTILTGLTQLSIGVISVLALVFVCIRFLEHLDRRTEKHEASMMERENQIRMVEREVRTTVLDQLNQNTMVMADTVKSHERLMTMLDKK